MAARKSDSPAGHGPSEDCGPGADRDGCLCRAAVERAFAGMVAGGVPNSQAMDAAARVFRYHHPECSDQHAHDTVETWLFTGSVH